MSRGVKHERIHQCIRCGGYDEKEEWCLPGGKDVFEPKKLRYCAGFTKKKEIKP